MDVVLLVAILSDVDTQVLDKSFLRVVSDYDTARSIQHRDERGQAGSRAQLKYTLVSDQCRAVGLEIVGDGPSSVP